MTEDDEAETQEVDEAEFDPRAHAALVKRNRENQSLRQRLKELEPLAAKAREADEAAKTAEQKAAEARQQAERERDEARAEVLRMRVASAKGLDASLASRLRGATEEELTKDADELLKLVKPTTQQPPRAVPDLRSGALPGGDSQPTNAGSAMDQQIRDAVRGGARRRIT